ncbi:MAG: hypothetical protein IJX13_06330, partial [Clostridia bacterium]|nr:hypothetical protein [Clostridia bacterium]
MATESVNSGALRRSTVVGVLIFAIFAALMIRVLIIQTVNFDSYQSKVINQMTTESSVPADRGKIYDINGNVLATNITTYRLFIDPSRILAYQQELDAAGNAEGIQYTDLIAKNLAALVEGVTEESVRK